MENIKNLTTEANEIIKDAEFTMDNAEGHAETVETTVTTETEEVEVFESEYYDAKAMAESGRTHAPSLLQGEMAPLLTCRNTVERSPDDKNIPVDELAVREEFIPEHSELIEQARAAGVFVQGKGTVEVPETGGVVFAGIWETPKHGRIIRVLFQRAQGEYTAPIEFDNAIFTIAAQSEFKFPDKSNPFYKDIVNFHKKAVTEIIDRLPLGTGINYEAVLWMLWKYHDQLPLHELIQGEASIETIYGKILQFVAAHGTARHNGVSYFRLNNQEMKQIADELDMSIKEVCLVLKDSELLYLTKSSAAYQTKVTYKGESGNYYCVLKNFEKKSIHPQAPTILEDGAKVKHDGTVSMPLTLYQQLFGDSHPAALSGSSKNSKKMGVTMWDDDL